MIVWACQTVSVELGVGKADRRLYSRPTMLAETTSHGCPTRGVGVHVLRKAVCTQYLDFVFLDSQIRSN